MPTKKFIKQEIQKTAKHYEQELIEDINSIRESEGKKPLASRKEENLKVIKISNNDPDAGYYVKSEREKRSCL